MITNYIIYNIQNTDIIYNISDTIRFQDSFFIILYNNMNIRISHVKLLKVIFAFINIFFKMLYYYVSYDINIFSPFSSFRSIE